MTLPCISTPQTRSEADLPACGRIPGNLLVFRCERNVRPGTGRQPPVTASFLGLPEELMSISVIASTVRAHEARGAAYRRRPFHATGPGPIR